MAAHSFCPESSFLNSVTKRIIRTLKPCQVIFASHLTTARLRISCKLGTLGATARGLGCVLLRTGRACQISPLFSRRIGLRVELVAVVGQAVEVGHLLATTVV